ncbi:cation:proton antiporter [Streptomyces sp. NPDC050610]|uniref:cation:proton antiporter domain-containing protein n=1 Tax=Streptomyces sp. NPDC050610 TaxID=3157097 RepID=UPI003415B853
MDRLDGLLGDPDPAPQILVSLFIPALVYVASEHVHGSGVLAVLVYTLYMVNHPAPAQDAAARVSSDSFWEITETLITGVAFGLIGLELRTVANAVTDGWQGLLGPAALVVVTVVAVRVLWLLPAVWVSGRPERAQREVRWKLERLPLSSYRRQLISRPSSTGKVTLW